MVNSAHLKRLPCVTFTGASSNEDRHDDPDVSGDR